MKTGLLGAPSDFGETGQVDIVVSVPEREPPVGFGQPGPNEIRIVLGQRAVVDLKLLARAIEFEFELRVRNEFLSERRNVHARGRPLEVLTEEQPRPMVLR